MEQIADTNSLRDIRDMVLVSCNKSDYELNTILEMNWDTFLKNKRWYKCMNAWNLSLTRKLCAQCKVIYENK